MSGKGQTPGQLDQHLRESFKDQQDEVADRLAGGMGRATTRLQLAARRQVQRAGLGVKIEKSWRQATYPPKGIHTLRPAGLVFSKSTVLVQAFDRAPVILPTDGRAYLAIPTKEAEALGLARSDKSRKGGPVPGGQKRRVSMVREAERKLDAEIVSTVLRGAGPHQPRGKSGRTATNQLVILPTKKRGVVLMVLRRKGETGKGTPLFILVRQTKVPNLLDLGLLETEGARILPVELKAAMGAGFEDYL